MMEIPIDAVLLGLGNLALLVLAALGVRMGRKNGSDLNGAATALRHEVKELRDDLREAEARIARLTALYAECVTERDRLRGT